MEFQVDQWCDYRGDISSCCLFSTKMLRTSDAESIENEQFRSFSSIIGVKKNQNDGWLTKNKNQDYSRVKLISCRWIASWLIFGRRGWTERSNFETARICCYKIIRWWVCIFFSYCFIGGQIGIVNNICCILVDIGRNRGTHYCWWKWVFCQFRYVWQRSIPWNRFEKGHLKPQKHDFNNGRA